MPLSAEANLAGAARGDVNMKLTVVLLKQHNDTATTRRPCRGSNILVLPQRWTALLVCTSGLSSWVPQYDPFYWTVRIAGYVNRETAATAV